jgi:hypothetical protein
MPTLGERGAGYSPRAPPVSVSCQGVAPGSSARHDDKVLVTVGFGDGVWAARADYPSLEPRLLLTSMARTRWPRVTTPASSRSARQPLLARDR